MSYKQNDKVEKKKELALKQINRVKNTLLENERPNRSETDR